MHLLTTSSLRYVRTESGNGNIDARRYRPNVVIDSGDPVHLFPRSERPVADRLRRMQQSLIQCIFGHLLRDPEM
jgi:hypothetical protein